MRLAECPYCGKRIGYIRAFFTRTQGEYCCKKCRKESNVVISKGVFVPFIVAVVFALFILLAFFMFTDRDNLWFMFFVAVPFLIFYLFTPFFVTLKPKKKHMDSLYDTDMVESTITTPDPTVVNKRVTPNFIDDVILDDEKYKPSIDADIFNSIKNERKNVAETDGGTKPIENYQDLSSDKTVNKEKSVSDKTMPVSNLNDVPVKKNKTVSDDNVKIYEKSEASVPGKVKVDLAAAETEKSNDNNLDDMKNVIDGILSDDNNEVSLSDIDLSDISDVNN